MTLTDQVVLITGASTGIGAATARTLAAEGARVVLGARTTERLDELVAELGSDRAAARRCDVREEADVEALVALALERFGRLDAAFANAGYGGGGSVVDGSPGEWRDQLLTNVYGVALTCHHAVKPMLEAGHGHLVLTSSVAGRRIVSHNHMYSATKHAVAAIGEGLRRDLTGRVRVTVVEPGMVDTPFFDDRPSNALEADDIGRVVAFVLAQPARVAVNEVLVRPATQKL